MCCQNPQHKHVLLPVILLQMPIVKLSGGSRNYILKALELFYFLKSAILLLKFYPKEIIMAIYKDLTSKTFIPALVRIVMFFPNRRRLSN